MHVVSTRRAWYEVLLCGVLLPLALVLCGVAFRLYARTAYPTDYEEQVSAAAAACDLPPSLIYAVIRTESGFRPDVVSAADARGLMQITEKTFAWAQQRSPEAEELSPDRLYDPAVNIRYGSYILALLYEMFEDTDTVLAAYNAGAGRVQEWLADSTCSSDGKTLHTIPYAETEEYVRKVRKAQEMYRKLYEME